MVNQVQQVSETGRNLGAAPAIANVAASGATSEAITTQAARPAHDDAAEETATTTADAAATSVETLIRPASQTDQTTAAGENAVGSLTIVVAAKSRADAESKTKQSAPDATTLATASEEAIRQEESNQPVEIVPARSALRLVGLTSMDAANRDRDAQALARALAAQDERAAEPRARR